MKPTVGEAKVAESPKPRARSPRRAAKKPSRQYHHGDLRRALVEEAVHTIQEHGVEALTLRAVGQRLGVSRTALYRHFADKSALLGDVAREGFRMLRLQTREAWEHGHNRKSFSAMGHAYVRFAKEHSAHYRVMFGGAVRNCPPDSPLAQEGAGAFGVLVEALVALQQRGDVRKDDPMALARFVWSVVHGIAMLAIDGQLDAQGADADDLVRYALLRLESGILTRG